MYEKKCSKLDCDNYKTIFDTRHTVAIYSHNAIKCRGKNLYDLILEMLMAISSSSSFSLLHLAIFRFNLKH